MKKSEFEKITLETPIYMARFKIIKIPDYADLYGSIKIEKGDYFLYHKNDLMVPEKRGLTNLSPCSSMFKFVGYVRVKVIYDGHCEYYEIIE